MAAKTKLEILLLAKDEASGKIKNVQGALGDLGGTVAKGAAIGLGAAAVGLGAVGAGALKLARDAAPIQGVTDAFKGLADSANFSADEMLGALRDQSAGLITNADLMTTFNKAAGLVSVDFAQNLPNAMNALGKVAAATGEDMGFLMDSLVTGVGRLSPMILDNLQIQVDLVAASEAWAEANDRTVESMTKSEQQAALMDQVMQKLAANTESLPDVAGSAEQKFASLGIQFQNMKDQIGVALLPIFTRLLDFIGPALTRAFETVMPAIETFVDLIGQLIGVISEMGLQSSETQEVLASMFGEDIATQIMGVIDGFIWLKDTISEFVTTILIPFVQEHWESIKAALIAVGAILAGAAIVSGILSIAAAIAALFNPITLIIGAVALLAVAWTQNWGGIQDKVESVLNFIRELIGSVLGWITSFWDQHGATIMGIVNKIWAAIGAIFDWFVQYVTIIFEAWQAAFSGDWETFGAKIREAWDHVWEAVKSILGNAWDWIKEQVANAIAAIIRFFTETDWRQVGIDVVQGIANGIEAGAKWAIDAITNLANALWDTIKGFFGAQSPSKLMASLGEDLMKGLGIGIVGGASIPTVAALGASGAVAGAISGSYNSSATNSFFINNQAAAALVLESIYQDEIDEINQVV